jgi:hypothetical protein
MSSNRSNHPPLLQFHKRSMQDLNDGPSPLPKNVPLRNTGIVGIKSEKLPSDHVRLRKLAIE